MPRKPRTPSPVEPVPPPPPPVVVPPSPDEDEGGDEEQEPTQEPIAGVDFIPLVEMATPDQIARARFLRIARVPLSIDGKNVTPEALKNPTDGGMKFPLDATLDTLEQVFGGGRYVVTLCDAGGRTLFGGVHAISGEPRTQARAEPGIGPAAPLHQVGGVFAVRDLKPEQQRQFVEGQSTIAQMREDHAREIESLKESHERELASYKHYIEQHSNLALGVLKSGMGGNQNDELNKFIRSELDAARAKVTTLDTEVWKLTRENNALAMRLERAQEALKRAEETPAGAPGSTDWISAAIEHAMPHIGPMLPAVLEKFSGVRAPQILHAAAAAAGGT